MINKVINIGYSGHAFVVCDALLSNGFHIYGYCEKEEKTFNPYQLEYFGPETGSKAKILLQDHDYFISIGDNSIRRKIFDTLVNSHSKQPINAIHPSSVISNQVEIGRGVFIAASVVINPLVRLGHGVICNTSCVIEHECQIEDFAHIAPGAVLAGNVQVGKRSFIGANAVVKQGIKIGDDVTIGAGAVVLTDVNNGAIVFGNPARPKK